MRAQRRIAAFALVFGLALASAIPAIAARWDKKTNLTVHETIEIPGATLKPGQYTVQLVDSQANRHIVRFSNANDTETIATVIAIPNRRLEPTGDTKFSFYETPSGEPPALRAWFYPGDTFGQEFAYPEQRAQSLSKQAQSNVPSISDEDMGRLREQEKKTSGQQAERWDKFDSMTEEEARQRAEKDPYLVVMREVEVYRVDPEGQRSESATSGERSTARRGQSEASEQTKSQTTEGQDRSATTRESDSATRGQSDTTDRQSRSATPTESDKTDRTQSDADREDRAATRPSGTSGDARSADRAEQSAEDQSSEDRGSQLLSGWEVEDTRVARQVRQELVTLPYYSVWDTLKFQVEEDGTVVLMGKVHRPTLKSGAERVVRNIEGVRNVKNEIEVLPVSGNDDRIRRAVYQQIYSHPALQRYSMRAVPPIHIIVENGDVTLEGVVGNKMDKNIAGIEARSVNGVFSVENNLRVEG